MRPFPRAAGSPDSPSRSASAQRPSAVIEFDRVHLHERPVRCGHPERPQAGDAFERDLDRFRRPSGEVEGGRETGIAATDIVVIANVLGDRQRLADHVEPALLVRHVRQVDAERRHRVAFDLPCTHGPGKRNCLLGHRHGRPVASAEHEDLCEPGQHACPVRRRRRLRHVRDGCPVGRECGVELAGGPERAPESLEEEPGPDGIPSRFEQVDPFAEQGRGSPELAAKLGSLRASTQDLRSIHSSCRGRLPDDVPQLEHALVLPERLEVGAGVIGSRCRPDRCDKRTRQLATLEPVMRDLGEVAGLLRAVSAGGALERLGDDDVEPSALAWQDGLGRGLPDERVPERVSLHDRRLVRHEELRLDGLLQRVEEVALRQVGKLRQQIVVHLPANDGRHPEQSQRSLRHVGEPCRQHLAQRRGKAAGLGAGREELLGEERIAVRALEDRRDEIPVRRVPEDPGQLAGDRLRPEPPQLDSFDPREAVRLGEPEEERVAPGELIASERDQEEQRLRLRVPDEERKQLPGRIVCPVEVLDRQDDRPPTTEPSEQVEERFVQPAASPLRAQLGPGRCDGPPIGQQPQLRGHAEERAARRIVGFACLRAGSTSGLLLQVETADERAQRLDDRREGQ